MDATTGRHEEFKGSSWTAALIAILLAVSLGASVVHANAQAPAHPAPVHASSATK